MDKHTPVLLKESISLLSIRKGGVYVDCTFGSGGHTEKILESLDGTGKLIAFDFDQSSLQWTQHFSSDNFFFVNDNFANLSARLDELEIKNVDGFLFDLGLSSMQIESERGFSYRKEAPLDMRMNQNSTLTAADIVNKSSLDEMADIFYRFGEERKAYKAAAALINHRKKKEIETSQDLARITAGVIGKQKGKAHPSKKIFQALRIKVNGEIENLQTALDSSLNYLSDGGRIVVISYHSLEDRIVKRLFLNKSKEEFFLPHKKPLSPARDEIEKNNRSRSAKLRVLAKNHTKTVANS